ncbi:MAG: hypothetical protein HY368_02080, partial [Candidatus Aenigmarchaeota archaeon]|nr:hypothetical protein [Candidatus Aenigmarchaeota archaeon]
VIPWLEENIPAEYKSAEEVALAFDYLSKSDLFAARITKRQSWSLQKFSFDLALFGVALAKKRSYAGFVKYQPPRRFYSNNEATEKIAAALGVSKRKAREYTRLVSVLIQKDAGLAGKFSFDESDLDELQRQNN